MLLSFPLPGIPSSLQAAWQNSISCQNSTQRWLHRETFQPRGDFTVHVKLASVLFCFVLTMSCVDFHYWSCNTSQLLLAYVAVSFPRLEASWKQGLFSIELSCTDSSTVHKSQLSFQNFLIDEWINDDP